MKRLILVLAACAAIRVANGEGAGERPRDDASGQPSAAVATSATLPNGSHAGTRPPRARRASRPSGGLVEKAYEGPVLRVVDEAGVALPAGALAAAVEAVRLRSRLPLTVGVGERSRRSATLPDAGGRPRTSAPTDAASATLPGGEAAWRRAAEEAREAGVAAAVLVIDDAAYPFLMDSPDGRWAVLNVAAVKGDAAKLSGRLTKLVWNATVRAVGAGGCGDAFSVFAPFTTLAELDRLGSDPGPMGHNALIDAAKARGLTFVRLATYRTACQQGWAPAPTNDVQRAIWNQVHAIPDKPIKIEFDPKKDK